MLAKQKQIQQNYYVSYVKYACNLQAKRAVSHLYTVTSVPFQLILLVSE